MIAINIGAFEIVLKGLEKIMIKKGTDKHINKIAGSPSFYEIQKKCTLRNSSFA